MSSSRLEQRSRINMWHLGLTLIVLWLILDLGAAFFLPMPTYVGSDVEFDLQITVPYTIAMPTWVGRKRRRRRQLVDEALDSISRRQMSPPGDVDSMGGQFRLEEKARDDDDDLEEYDLSTREGATLARLDSLFDWLGLVEDACRHRLLCYVTQDPENYSPLSDVILQHMDPRRDDMSNYDSEEPGMHRFFQFYSASKKGFEPDTNCTLETLACPHSPDRLLDWNTMRRVQQISRLIKLRFNEF